jgi:3-oxoacyl-[acyl-carrier protein] reductase
MKSNEGGTVTVVSSLTAKEPIDYLATSSVLRAGLPAWIKLMAQEYGQYGIRINAVMAGYTQTALLEEAAMIEAEKDKVSVEDTYRKWSSSFALKRVAKPSEIAHAALFLASQGASYITGTSLLVDGGAVRGI